MYTDEMDTISFGISENITIDSLMNGLFDDNWYITELNDNNIKIYSNNPNSSLNGNLGTWGYPIYKGYNWVRQFILYH